MVNKKQAAEIDVDWSVLPNIIPVIFPIVKNSLLVLGYQRNFDILCKRYGLDGNNIYTLQEIGSFLGITRERVRQLEEKAEEILRKVLCGQQSKINVPSNLIDEVNGLSEAIIATGPLITEDELTEIFYSRYQYEPRKSEFSSIELLLSILRFELLTEKPPRPNVITKQTWITVKEFDRQQFYEVRRKTDEILVETVAPLSFFDLVVKVNKGRKKPISQSTVRLAIKTMAYVERVDEDSYQVCFTSLKSIADKVHRILIEHKAPLNLRELHREINHRLALSQSGTTVSMRSISQQLTLEPHRFVSISRGSLWGLSEWPDLKKGTIIDAMFEYFYVKKGDASAADILEYVKKRFPDVPIASVYAYLSQKDKFTRVSANTFAPAAWKWKPYILERSPRTRKKETLRQKIQEAVINYLSVRPNEWVRLEKLKEYIVVTINCIAPTFYLYLSEMERMGQVDKEKRSDGVYCKIRLTQVAKESQSDSNNWLAIISAGETRTVEFKRAAKWNDYEKKPDGSMIQEVVIEVAGFMNSDFPGQIFIGVDDKTHELLGLEEDFKVADKGKPNQDGYTLFLSNAISSKLGNDLGVCYDIQFQEFHNKILCCIAINPAPRIVYYDGHLYLRGNGQTNRLTASEAVEYVGRRNKASGARA